MLNFKYIDYVLYSNYYEDKLKNNSYDDFFIFEDEEDKEYIKDIFKCFIIDTNKIIKICDIFKAEILDNKEDLYYYNEEFLKNIYKMFEITNFYINFNQATKLILFFIQSLIICLYCLHQKYKDKNLYYCKILYQLFIFIKDENLKNPKYLLYSPNSPFNTGLRRMTNEYYKYLNFLILFNDLLK